jgi:hypothetical protein
MSYHHSPLRCSGSTGSRGSSSGQVGVRCFLASPQQRPWALRGSGSRGCCSVQRGSVGCHAAVFMVQEEHPTAGAVEGVDHAGVLRCAGPG